MIDVQQVTKTYDELTAVDGVSMHLARGRTLGIIGPNGSGKTTLLRMIGTLVKPTKGRLTVAGFDVVGKPREVRRRIAFMPAEGAAPSDMTIGEYMRYFACAKGVPRAERERAVAEALELTDMDGRDELSISGLSTGNRQRLLLAKTLLGDPQLLLLDEPASGLDPRARIEVRGFLKTLAGLGKTIVISSHILADIEEIATDILILEQGKARLGGTLAEIQAEAASQKREVALAVAPEADEVARRVLEAHEQVTDLRPVGDGRFELISTQEDCNPVLAALIESGVRILEFREQRPDLEDIFMTSTQGVVS